MCAPPRALSLYAYDNRFFDTADRTAAISAAHIVRLLAEQLPIRSVLDLGCGRGVWLAIWQRHGAEDIQGVDGPYISLDRLHIPRERFLSRDLAEPLVLDRQFDLVESLEVAEHIPEQAADAFIDSLTRHGKLILFSAATPGQGGENHVNEQPPEYWQAKFAARDFDLFDFLRPRVASNKGVYLWYRHNVFVYAHRSIASSLPPAIAATCVPRGQAPANIAPYWTRIRKGLVRYLPRPLVDGLARSTHSLRNSLHALSRDRS
jgi:SAM-dependent methyltransferase